MHTQTPASHARFGPQLGDVPHRHCPPEQVSALAVSQTMQAPPPVGGQVLRLSILQLLPRQHPVGQEVASHWQVAEAPVPTHRRPRPQAVEVPHRHWPEPQLLEVAGRQAVQGFPFVPHAEMLGGALQVAPLQQPPTHEAALQTQAPETQS